MVGLLLQMFCEKAVLGCSLVAAPLDRNLPLQGRRKIPHIQRPVKIEPLRVV